MSKFLGTVSDENRKCKYGKSREKNTKAKKSFLDPFYNDIKYLYDLGVTISNITKIIKKINKR
jgi:hypothetical protein